MTLMTPTVHLNGTSRAALFEQQAEAAGALRRAIQVLQDAAPHGRDYYPQGPDAYKRARSEHEARIATLRSVLAEVETLAEAIQEAGR